MERILKFVLLLFSFCLIVAPRVLAQDSSNLSTLITAQSVKFEDCTKVFNTDNISLFYLTVAAINANRFSVDEIQSSSGYVIFTAVGKKFLASVSNVNTNQGMLKITPIDNNYFFQPGIVLNIFKFISVNLTEKPENVILN